MEAPSEVQGPKDCVAKYCHELYLDLINWQSDKVQYYSSVAIETKVLRGINAIIATAIIPIFQCCQSFFYISLNSRGWNTLATPTS